MKDGVRHSRSPIHTRHVITICATAVLTAVARGRTKADSGIIDQRCSSCHGTVVIREKERTPDEGGRTVHAP
jgi:cytochrome c553